MAARVVRSAHTARRRPAPTTGNTSIATYRAKRDFTATPEPAPANARKTAAKPIFVVQKHDATRLHWDFRLEHAGVLWSWAVPRGPSLDPHDKRLAVHVEDHPIDYADFTGTIPEGHYGAGTVELWDRGTWSPLGDAEAGLARGELKFTLHGKRLSGRFVLIRLKPRVSKTGRPERAENWLLIKEHDAAEREGADADALERKAAPKPAKPPAVLGKGDAPPLDGAIQALLPTSQAPQLATLAEAPPAGEGWLNEIKFDGYRLIAIVEAGRARLLTRNGLDWTGRLPAVAAAIGKLALDSAMLDGELVALRPDGVTSFAELQAALAGERRAKLFYYLFDLLYLNGWDLRRAPLVARKQALRALGTWRGMLRYSDHIDDRAATMRRQACAMGLEGIVCKRADAPYRAGRSRDWLKLKCQGHEEFVVLGWTPPAGSRRGLGALHLGYRDPAGRLHYAGGVGTGFSDRELAALRRRLDELEGERPSGLLYVDEPPDRRVVWVRPELVAEIQYVGWTDAGRVRHAVYLGLREDKTAAEVVRDPPDGRPHETQDAKPARIVHRTGKAKKPRPADKTPDEPASARPTRTVTARAPKATTDTIGGVRLTHGDRELWPGISKRALAEYWLAVAPHALPGIARRPLALLRCPEGIAGEHFFQKHGRPGMPAQFTEGKADGAPYLAIDDEAGLVAAAQMAAIELHSWGSHLPDPLHPDRLVFDLDPSEDVAFATVVATALELHDRLKSLGLASFCRTSGGKGLHVVAPLAPRAGWDAVRAWCRAFAESLEAEFPDRFVASVPKAKRRGRILIDWLRNGLGATAIASYSPRARPGAPVATPLAWSEVTARLDPLRFTVATVPKRLATRKADPWSGWPDLDQSLPETPAMPRRRR